MPLIVAMIPYADDKNLGRAHNAAMSLLPEDGWGCLLDHDVMFTTREWHRQLTRAVELYPEGTFCAMTHRIFCPFQIAPEANLKDHNITSQRAIGLKRLENTAITDVTDHERTPGGFLMCLSKQAWRDTNGFPEGFHLMDKRMWTALKMVGRRIYLIEGLYLYHWHRGGGPDADPWLEGPPVARHVLPDGRVLEGAEGTLVFKMRPR